MVRAKTAAQREKRDELVRELRAAGWSLRRIAADRRVRLSAVSVREILAAADPDKQPTPVVAAELLTVDAALDLLDRLGIGMELRALLAGGDELVTLAMEGWCVQLTEVVAGERLDELTAWRVENDTRELVYDVEAYLSPDGYSEARLEGARGRLQWYADRAGQPPDLRHLDADDEDDDDDEPLPLRAV